MFKMLLRQKISAVTMKWVTVCGVLVESNVDKLAESDSSPLAGMFRNFLVVLRNF